MIPKHHQAQWKLCCVSFVREHHTFWDLSSLLFLPFIYLESDSQSRRICEESASSRCKAAKFPICLYMLSVVKERIHSLRPFCCLCTFGVHWTPEDLTCCTHSTDECQQFRATTASCWEKSSAGNLWLIPTAVILSHTEASLGKRATCVLAN